MTQRDNYRSEVSPPPIQNLSFFPLIWGCKRDLNKAPTAFVNGLFFESLAFSISVSHSSLDLLDTRSHCQLVVSWSSPKKQSCSLEGQPPTCAAAWSYSSPGACPALPLLNLTRFLPAQSFSVCFIVKFFCFLTNSSMWITCF